MIDKTALRLIQPSAGVESAKANGNALELSKKFGAYLSEALDQVHNQNVQVGELQQAFVKGELTDVHTLMIAAEKASLGLELTVQVRNKVIEAYQEIMRMQI